MKKTLHVLRKAVGNVGKAVTLQPMMFMPDILVTHHCTQRCLQCAIPLSASSKLPFMRVEDFKTIIDRLDRHGTQAVNISGGEPMLHPHLPELIEYAASKNLGRIHLLTTLYGPERLVERTVDLVLSAGVSISVSFDGFGEIADTLRGARNVAETVQRNIAYVKEEIRRRRKRINCAASVVLSRLNLPQMRQILDYLERVGWITELDVYRWQAETQREVENLKIRNTAELREIIGLAKRSPVVVTPPWLLDLIPNTLDGMSEKYCPYISLPTFGTKVFIHPDGSVGSCRGGAFGNLLEQTPEEIFRSEGWKKQKENQRACKGCGSNIYTRVKYLVPTTVKEWKANWGKVWNV